MIIGSHDSCAYKLDFSVGFWPALHKFEVLRRLAWLPCVKNRLYKVTQTQSLSVKEQLAAGCRALDIRVSYKKGVFYTNHTFCCITFTELLNQVKSWIDESNQPEDKVYILIKPDWETRSTMANKDEEFLKFLMANLSAKLSRCLLYYQYNDENNQKLYPVVKNLNTMRFIWPDTNTVEKFTAKFGELGETIQNSQLLFVLTMSSAPSVSEIFRTDIRDFAKSVNPLALTLLEKNNLPMIVMFDFVNADFIASLRRKFL